MRRIKEDRRVVAMRNSKPVRMHRRRLIGEGALRDQQREG